MTDTQKKAALVVVAAGILAWLFWPKKAKAEYRALVNPEQAPPVVMAAESTQKYTVQRGDSYSMIAAKLYGDGTATTRGDPGWKWWPLLWDMNKGVTGCNRNLIKPGQVLTVPLKSALPMDQMDAIFARAPNWKNPPPNCGI